MIIKESAFEIIKEIEKYTDKEFGGILGSTDGQVINAIAFDSSPNHDVYTYSPNIKYLNSVLVRWSKKGIVFKGMFHSHLFGIKQLSEKDEDYIKTVMNSLQDESIKLFFPIYVLPDNELINYIGVKSLNGVSIYKGNVWVIP